MPPRLYAHRGAAAERPENTLEAFHRAIARGADALEMDVHLTRDGQVVVSHDPDGARMCDRPLEIRRTLKVDLDGWDAGWGFVDPRGGRPFRGRGLRVPTLDEVLREFPDRVINVDVKQWSPPMVEPLLALLRRERAEERVVLASFQLATLLRIRAAGYRGTTALAPAEVALLLTLPRAAWRALPCTGTAAQIPLEGGGRRLDTREVIERCHDRGLRVDYWTVNDAATASRLIALGADGIMTDDPGAVAPAFGRVPAA